MPELSVYELNLSTKLNCRLGELRAEISQLPSDHTIGDWTTSEVLHAVCRAKDALIDALHCALRLSQLGEIDEVSRGWIDEALQCVERDQSLLDYVEETLVRDCPRSLL